MERFVFEISQLVSVEMKLVLVCVGYFKFFISHGRPWPPPARPFRNGISAEELEGHLRAFLLKVATCDSHLSPNPPGWAKAFT